MTAMAREDSASRPPRPGCLSVLVVDDHPDSVRALALLLRAEGHQVATAVDLASARVLARAGGGFDLVVADVTLPDGDGCGLLGDVRAAGHPTARGAVVTGHSAEAERPRCRAAGFEWVLSKPLDVSALLAVAAEVADARA